MNRASTSPNGRSGTAPVVYFMMIVVVAGGRPGPISASAAARIRPSPSRPWWCRPHGRAPRSTTRSSRSPTASRRSSRRRRTSITSRATRRAGPGHDLRRTSRTRRPPQDGAGHLVSGAQEGRDIRSTLPQGIIGPVFNDEFGDTFGIVYGFTADGFTHRELRDYVEKSARACCRCRTSRRSTSSAPRTSGSTSSSRPEQLAGLGIDRAALIRALQAQNAVSPAGVVQTGHEKILSARLRRLRVRAGSRGESTSRRRPHDPPGDIAHGHARPSRPAAADVPRQRRARHRRSPSRCATGGDVLALGRRRRAGHGGDHARTCRSASSRTWSPTSPSRRRACGRRVHEGAVGGGRDRARGQLAQPRPARGRRRGLLDPAGARRWSSSAWTSPASTCSASRSAPSSSPSACWSTTR